MTDHDDLNDAGLSGLYRKLPRQEPSATTDAVIRRLAHDAVKQKRPRSRMPAFAVAATLLLGAVVSFQVFQQAPQDRTDSYPREDKTAVAETEVAKVPAPVAAGVKMDAAGDVLAPMSTFSPLKVEKRLQQERALEMYQAERQQKSRQRGITDVACGQTALTSDSEPQAWLQQIKLLREQGDRVQADCLERAYWQRFGGIRNEEKNSNPE